MYLLSSRSVGVVLFGSRTDLVQFLLNFLKKESTTEKKKKKKNKEHFAINDACTILSFCVILIIRVSHMNTPTLTHALK